MVRKTTRRRFLESVGLIGTATAWQASRSLAGMLEEGKAPAVRSADSEKPVLLGGKPTYTGSWPGWPRVSQSDTEAVLEVAQSARWYRSRSVEQFEEQYAALNQAKYCIATSSGTTALYSSLGALGVGPGDEVLVAPYTFMASVTVILLHYALPVFVDSDRESFLMDPGKLEAAITPRTKAILPVHIGGNVADLDRILAVAEKHKIPVVGDACQSHLAQWRGRSAGSWGTTGCYSFQLSKNLCSGEGGAILTNDEAVADACFAFHNCSRRRPKAGPNASYRLGRNGNFRMTEFQGALLLKQMEGLEDRARLRSDNAAHLTKLLRQIPGIYPAKEYEGCTRNAYHLYMFRYDPAQFAGLSRSQFLRAVRAEGIPCSAGYGPLNEAGFLLDALRSEPYVRVYGQKTIDDWPARNQCPENDKLCEEAVWCMHTLFLTDHEHMERIAAAIAKIHKHAAALTKV